MLEQLGSPESQDLVVEGGGEGLYFQVVGLNSWGWPRLDLARCPGGACLGSGEV